MADWIAGAVGKGKGGLHRSTGTPLGQKIPAKKIAQAEEGAFGKKAVKQAQLARTLSKMRK